MENSNLEFSILNRHLKIKNVDPNTILDNITYNYHIINNTIIDIMFIIKDQYLWNIYDIHYRIKTDRLIYLIEYDYLFIAKIIYFLLIKETKNIEIKRGVEFFDKVTEYDIYIQIKNYSQNFS